MSFVITVKDSGKITLSGAKGKIVNVYPNSTLAPIPTATSSVSEQEVIKKFMKSLDTTNYLGISALNQAVSVASGGSTYQNNASSIVPESGNLEAFTVNGLTVKLGSIPYSGGRVGSSRDLSFSSLNSKQKYIWQAFKTWWARRCTQSYRSFLREQLRLFVGLLGKCKNHVFRIFRQSPKQQRSYFGLNSQTRQCIGNGFQHELLGLRKFGKRLKLGWQTCRRLHLPLLPRIIYQSFKRLQEKLSQLTLKNYLLNLRLIFKQRS